MKANQTNTNVVFFLSTEKPLETFNPSKSKKPPIAKNEYQIVEWTTNAKYKPNRNKVIPSIMIGPIMIVTLLRQARMKRPGNTGGQRNGLGFGGSAAQYAGPSPLRRDIDLSTPEEGNSYSEASSTESCSCKRARSFMFRSSVWSTPDKMTFQGHPSGICSTIPPIEAASCRESFARCLVGRRRPTIRPAIPPPSTIAIGSMIFFIASPCIYYWGPMFRCSPIALHGRQHPTLPQRALP